MVFWEFKNKADSADLYIYGEFTSKKWDDSDVTAKEFVNDLKKARGKDITVHVNSPGGDVFQAVAIYNALKNYKGKVEVQIEGLAASAASLIVCAGDEVKMAANAQLMIHAPSVWLMGYYGSAEIEKVKNALTAVEGTILETYKSRLPKKNHSQVAEMMLSESWINATDAKELGFIDEITDAIEITDKAEVTEMEENKTEEKLQVLDVKAANELLIKDAIKQAREQELARIKNLMALRGENAAVNAIIDTALSEGAQVADVVKYIDAVKNVKAPETKNAGIDELKATIRDNMTSGAENIGAPAPPLTDEEKRVAVAKSIAEMANALRGVKKNG